MKKWLHAGRAYLSAAIRTAKHYWGYRGDDPYYGRGGAAGSEMPEQPLGDEELTAHGYAKRPEKPKAAIRG